MPAPFFLAALFGKAAAGAVSKGLAAKTSAHHGHRALVKKVGRKIMAKIRDEAVERALLRSEETRKGE